MEVIGGDTNITTYFAMRLTATGQAATGLTPTDFDLQYVRSGAAPSAKVDASALGSVGAAHSDNGVIEVDVNDQPGIYRVDWPDAAFAAGVREVVLTAKVATAFSEHLAVEITTPSEKYQGGHVWVDTVNGAAGTVPYINGTSENPVDSIADAKTIADAINLKKFMILSGSSITLAATYDGYEFFGQDWTLTLGNQSVSGAHFEHCMVQGSDDGSNAVMTHYEHCVLNGNTLGQHVLEGCSIFGPLVLAEAGDYIWIKCQSAIAGTGAPVLDFQSAAEVKDVSIRSYSGGVHFHNLGAGGGTHTVTLEGVGQYILNANCAGGTLVPRGAFTETDNAGGSVTVVDDARITQSSIAFANAEEILTGATHNVAKSLGRRIRELLEIGTYDGAAVWIDTNNGTAGTEDFVNGLSNNPVDSIADAKTLADSMGLVRFRILSGSSITLAANFDGYEFLGENYTVALGGQSVSGTHFEHATITGNDDGSNASDTHYKDCSVGGNTLGLHTLEHCSLGAGDIVLAEAGDYLWEDCHSHIAGAGAPGVDFQSAVEVKSLSMRHYSGGIEYKNFNAGGGTHLTTIEGMGQIIAAASCAGGDIEHRGHFKLTDNSGGAVTFVDATLDVNLIKWLGTAAATPTVAGVPEVDATHILGEDLSSTDAELNLKSLNIFNVDGTAVTIGAGNNGHGIEAGGQGTGDGMSLGGGSSGGSGLVATKGAGAGEDIVADIRGTIDEVAVLTDHTPQTGDSFTRLAAPAGASVSADIAAVKAQTGEIETDTGNIQSRLPGALSSGNMKADVVALSGSTDAADQLERSAKTIVDGLAEAGTLSTTQMSTDLTEATDDHFNGRIIIWTSGALTHQASDITDYVGVNGVLTFTAVTEAPSATDSFIIV